MTLNTNLIADTDSYKLTHYKMYKDDVDGVYSYFEAREGARFDNVVFFGLQYMLKNYLTGVVITQEDIEEASELCQNHMGSDDIFNREGWEYILNEHGGKLPVRIKAVPEGTPVPVSNVLMTIETTDPKVPWLTNYLETFLSRVWYPSTVATLSRETKKMVKGHFDATDTPTDMLDFLLHDFGSRGVSSFESAAIGGAAHLLNFVGTDTVAAMELLHRDYGAAYEGLAFSVPASEHSVMTQNGPDGEREVLEHLLDTFPSGILSVVSDSYSIYDFVENFICKDYKDRIMEREGIFVVRPDSVSTIHTTPEEQVLWIVGKLWDSFGGTETSTGHKLLDGHVRVLWGDGINYDGINKILTMLVENGYSPGNMATFGMGGGLLQKVNRDTQKFAFKCSAMRRDGVWHDVWKQPAAGSGKNSKRGRMSLVEYDGKLTTVSEPDRPDDLLEVVFENGELVREQSLEDIRERASIEEPALV